MILASSVSCSDFLRKDSGNIGSSPLRLSVCTGTPDSRAMITGTNLGTGEEIGIALTDDKGGNYDGVQYSNVRYRSTGTSPDQSWNADSEIMLSANKAVLYAYYPYSAEITDIRRIPVSSTSEIQTDYMYAEPVTDLNNHNSEAFVTLKHALAAIRVTFKRGNYTGAGNITAISVSGGNMATEGILDAMDGSLSSLKGAGSVISPDISPFSLDSEGNNIDMMAIPTGQSSSLTIGLTMDGEEFSVTTEETVLSRGMVSVFEINVNNSSVTIDPVKVKAWDLGQKTSTSLQKSWHVSFSGDMEDITIDSPIEDDGSVTIIATPQYQEAEINPVTVTGTATVTDNVHNGVRTITLSDIGSDINIGFDSYSLWITAVYNITSTDSETKLLFGSSYCRRLEVDGEEVDPAQYYQFESTGEHQVRIIFTDKSTIPDNAFRAIGTLTGVSIPEGVKTLGTRCLYNCSKLTSVNIAQTVTGSGYEVMAYSNSLKYVDLPENLDMGYGMFSNCNKIESVTLPKNLKILRSLTFYRCYGLSNIDIPESVTVIEKNAFESSGLSSVTLPVGLQAIEESAFNVCSSLCNIRYSDGTECSSELIFREGLKSIGGSAFTRCRQLTAVHIPSTVTKIGAAAFTAEGIQSITVAQGNPVYCTIDGFTGIVESSSGTLICGACNSTVIPPEITRIGDEAFTYLPISSIDLHDKITYIGNQAFYSNSNKKLKTIISRSLTPPQLGSNSVFGGCLTGGKLMVPESAVQAYESSSWMSQESGFLGKLGWSVTAL